MLQQGRMRHCMDFEKMRRHPPVAEIAYRTNAINEYGLDAMYLLAGTEKALLIDTGTGVFDLPGLIAARTELPLMVALTHGHPDHAGGMGWFDRVYANPADFGMALGASYENRRDFARSLDRNPASPVTNADTVVFEKQPEMLPLQEGDVIDLGGRQVVVYETPGHSPGGLSFLDVRERILFVGDACNGNTLMLPFGGTIGPRQTVSALLETCRKIQRLEPYFDRNYNGHIGFGGTAYGAAAEFTLNEAVLPIAEEMTTLTAWRSFDPYMEFGDFNSSSPNSI